LGAGAFGKVYNGFNIISNENVALKVIYKEELNKIKNGLTMLHN
jgi:serine/threonine protein kinase